jgi:hypothetical protein
VRPTRLPGRSRVEPRPPARVRGGRARSSTRGSASWSAPDRLTGGASDSGSRNAAGSPGMAGREGTAEGGAAEGGAAEGGAAEGGAAEGGTAQSTPGRSSIGGSGRWTGVIGNVCGRTGAAPAGALPLSAPRKSRHETSRPAGPGAHLSGLTRPGGSGVSGLGGFGLAVPRLDGSGLNRSAPTLRGPRFSSGLLGPRFSIGYLSGAPRSAWDASDPASGRGRPARCRAECVPRLAMPAIR